MTDQTLQLLLNRLDHLTAEFQELRDGVKKAVRISDDDPEMALTRARKVLEYVIRDVFALRCQEDPGTRPLENLLQRLNKDGHLPKRLVAYASYIRDLGNVGTHIYGEELSKDDVRRSFENLTAILEWYFERVRPDAFMKAEDPLRADTEVRRFAVEEAHRRDEELERKSREAEELKRLEVAEARAEVKRPAQTTTSAVSHEENRLVQRQEEKSHLLAPPTSRPTVLVILALGIFCLIVAVFLFLVGLGGGLIFIAVFLMGLLLVGIATKMRMQDKHEEEAHHRVEEEVRRRIEELDRNRGEAEELKDGAEAEVPRPPAHQPDQSPAAPQRRSFIRRVFSGTLGKIVFGAICGFVGGAIAAPILDFYKPEPIFGALLVGILHGLVIGVILMPIGKAQVGKVFTSLAGIIIGAVVGVTIRAIIASLSGSHYWYLSASDGQAVEIMGGGILGFILGLVHGSKRKAR